MRKISFKVRNIGSEKYLSYILNDDCEFDEELLDYLEENRIPELIDIIYEEDDENDYLTYNVTGRTTVDALLSNTVNAEKILGIIRGVASGIVNLRDLGIPASYLVLHKEFTYVNPVTYDVGMLCVPVESEANINAEFRMFAKDLLTSVTVDKMNSSIPEFVSQYYVINKKDSEEEQKAAEDFLVWLYTSDTGKDYITNKFAFVPFNADESEKLENPLSNSLVYYMSNDLVMGNDFDAFPESWGLNTIGATIQEQLFTNPDQWDENTIRTGVEDALTKWKDSIKE